MYSFVHIDSSDVMNLGSRTSIAIILLPYLIQFGRCEGRNLALKVKKVKSTVIVSAREGRIEPSEAARVGRSMKAVIAGHSFSGGRRQPSAAASRAPFNATTKSQYSSVLYCTTVCTASVHITLKLVPGALHRSETKGLDSIAVVPARACTSRGDHDQYTRCQ